MPLHRNEQGNEKSLNFKNMENYVKEKYMLTRERVSVFTIVSSDPAYPAPKPEFLFKGAGRVKLQPPTDVKVQSNQKIAMVSQESVHLTFKNVIEC